MNTFFGKLSASMRTFMMGRYGFDALSTVLVIIALVLTLIGSLTGFELLSLLGFAALAYTVFRCYSKNIAARQRELDWFDRVTKRQTQSAELAQKKWANRKTTKYFTCDECGCVYSLPKGKGRIRATCPKCHKQSIHTT